MNRTHFSCIFPLLLLVSRSKQREQLQKKLIHNRHLQKQLVHDELSVEGLHKNHSGRGSFVLGVFSDSISPQIPKSLI